MLKLVMTNVYSLCMFGNHCARTPYDRYCGIVYHDYVLYRMKPYNLLIVRSLIIGPYINIGTSIND